MDRPARLGDSPSDDRDDGLEVEVVAHPYEFAYGDRELHQLIVDAVNSMGGVGDDAEETYQARLRPLRERAREVVAAIGGDEGVVAAPEEHYLDRWALVQLVADLRTQAALGLAKTVLSQPIPEELSEDPHSFTTVGEEVMIRTTAIDALEALAADGDDDAIAILLDSLSHEQFTIRRAATQALLATGRDDVRDRVGQLLEERGDESILKIRRADVRRVPQATGGLFLVNREGKEGPPPLTDEPSD